MNLARALVTKQSRGTDFDISFVSRAARPIAAANDSPTVTKCVGWVAAIAVGQSAHGLILILPPCLLFLPARSQVLPLLEFGTLVVAAATMESIALTVVQNGQGKDTRGHVTDRLAIRMATVAGGLLLILFWSAQIEATLNHSADGRFQWTGLLLVVSGLILRLAAIMALRERFVSDIVLIPPLVRSGIYRHMRHPSEWGLLLIASGAPLWLGAWRTSVVGLLLLLLISVWRIRRENRQFTN